MGACARDGERCPPRAKLFTLLKLLGESSPRKVRVTGLLYIVLLCLNIETTVEGRGHAFKSFDPAQKAAIQLHVGQLERGALLGRRRRRGHGGLEVGYPAKRSTRDHATHVRKKLTLHLSPR